MKKIISILFLCFITISNLYSQWETIIDGANQSLDYDNISFVNEEVGWMSGNDTLYKTEDGGKTWIPIILPDGYWYDFNFYNDKIGLSRKEGEGAIQKTIDGGKSWTPIFDMNGDKQIKASFIDEDTIFVTLDGMGQMIKTIDGGKNWINITPKIEFNYFEIVAMNFIDSNNGYLVGNDDSGCVVLRTFDGGENWTENKIPQFERIIQVQFFDKQRAFFTASESWNYFNSENYFCETNDKFYSWTIRKSIPYPISSFYYIAKDSALIATMDDSLSQGVYKSWDNGVSWTEIQKVWNYDKSYYSERFNRVNTMRNIYITPSDIGYMNFLNGTAKSSDRGETWVIDGLYTTFEDIAFIDQNFGYAVGKMGMPGICCAWLWHVFSTNDGGKTWNHLLQTKYHISSIELSQESGVILADKEGIYSNENNGKSWEFTEWSKILPDYNFEGRDFAYIDEKNIWVVGGESDNGEVVGTADGGKTWEVLWDKDSSGELNSIFVINSSVWMVGGYRYIIKSTGVDNFEVNKIELDDNSGLDRVYFSDEEHGWILSGRWGDRQYLLKTTDGGETWLKKKYDKEYIKDVYFENNLHGWKIGNKQNEPQKIYESFDGGETWSAQTSELPSELNGFYYKDGILWAYGGHSHGLNGLLLRLKDGVSWVNQNGEVYPNKFYLTQNYPNPFNPTTKIKYQIPTTGLVSLRIYNLLGEIVTTLVNEEKSAGAYEIEFNAANLSSGVYFYQLQADNFVETKKLVLLK